MNFRRKNKSPRLDAEQVKLLTQAEQVMDFAQNVSSAGGGLPAGWKVIVDSAADEATTSGFFARIYERTGAVKEGQSKYMVAFRDTDKISDKLDLEADLEIALRKLPDQYWQALAFVQKTSKEKGLPLSEMEFMGYSLGGYLARTVGSTLGIKKIWTFDSPGPTKEIADYVEKLIPGISSPPGNNLIQIRSADDLISRWGYDEGLIFAVKTTGSPHSLTTLRQGIKDAISGQPPSPVCRLSLSSVFNAVSGRIAHARIVNKVIDKLFGQPKGPKDKPEIV